MGIFNYKAIQKKENGQSIVTGKVNATNLKEARAEVRNLGFIPIEIKEINQSQSNTNKIKSGKLKALSLKEKIDFTQTFKILTQSGVSVIESLIFLENDADSPRIRAVEGEVKSQILAGSTYSDTIAKYPHIFGQVYIGLTKAGEDSGEMEKTLGRLSELLYKQSQIKGRVFGALIYPVFVIVLAIAAFLIMIMFVFPCFKDMFSTMGKDLPIYTKICMDMGDFLNKYWVVLPVTLIASILCIYYTFKYESSRRVVDKLVLRIPIIGNLLKLADLTNFFSVLQVAYEAGIPIIDCLYLSNLTLSNSKLRDSIQLSSKRIQEGQHLSVALKSTKVIPQMMLFLVSIGEQSGRLGEMLQQGINYIDTELDKVIDAMTKLIEPIMLIFIGCMVLFLALSLYMPLFQSYQT